MPRFVAVYTMKPEDLAAFRARPKPEQDAIDMAERCGFENRYRHGAGEQYFWLWYFKRS